jgi:16S rRNA (guanine(966)-N(2))-methyltransferase RsmD
MRIIGGEYRGRILRMPKGVKIRPTRDRVREAIFNIIREAIPEARVLDLYAGSGAFGIEALSRGASSVVFVDNNINCIRIIKSNLSALGNSAKPSQVIKRDAVRAISGFQKEGKEFDIVFLDPPYHKDLARNCLIKIDACDILSQRGFVVSEHFVKDAMPDRIGALSAFTQRKYGDTVISFYRKQK